MEAKPASVVERVEFALLDESHLSAVLGLERAGFPADEAASEANMRLRLTAAKYLFLGAFHRSPATSGDLSPPVLIGFVCSTQTSTPTLTHASMSEHAATGPTVCVHSVCVDAQYRRQGVALALLRHYLAILSADAPARGYQRAALLCKSHLIPLYARAGFSLIGPSAVVHGQDQWYEMQTALPREHAGEHA
jgi:ribosomal protein S18 acetylase RimI-like enzyme